VPSHLSGAGSMDSSLRGERNVTPKESKTIVGVETSLGGSASERIFGRA